MPSLGTLVHATKACLSSSFLRTICGFGPRFGPIAKWPLLHSTRFRKEPQISPVAKRGTFPAFFPKPGSLLKPCATMSLLTLFVEAVLSIEHPLRTPPPDKPWARPTRTRVRTVHSAILRLAAVLHGHNLLRAPHKHLQRLCKIWSLVRRVTSEVAAAGAAATVSSLSLSLACPSSAADAGYR
jgi:hypothetical protein